MAIPSPTIPSSIGTVSAVRLSPTQKNRAFYCYSGLQSVTSSDTTMVSINDIGKRDVLLCFTIGSVASSSIDTFLYVKSNGVVIYQNGFSISQTEYINDVGEYKFVLPANTSLEIILLGDSGTNDWIVSAYGYYL